jgi:radical SAM enzyme (TIGR01210 family)
MTVTSPYPLGRRERDQWILARRPDRNVLDPLLPYAYFVEEERSGNGESVPVATIFLTNRECPWRCLMCDLWRNTLTETVPAGAIANQIEFGLSRLPPARHLKLYNSGSFFDPQAIPLDEYAANAEIANRFEHVIVESHPSFIGENCFRFRDLLTGSFEVAMGLETAHPEALARLNKGMTLEQFSAASARLKQNDVSLRVFVLVKPPFIEEEDAVYWAGRSIDFAFDCGASVVTLIPTRPGNGAVDALAEAGQFSRPKLKTLEAAFAYGINTKRGRVFADTWDLVQFSECDKCYPVRKQRIAQMNQCQELLPSVECIACGEEL